MSYFNYKNYNIYYNEFGKGEPLILLHGNTASSKMFSGIIGRYADFYKVIVIDFLGYGESDRVEKLPEDLWYDEALQVIEFLRIKKYRNVNIIGTSGGAIAAINVALEEPKLVGKLIADSFDGCKADFKKVENIITGREASKHDTGAVMFYKMMNGGDWESVVDKDTEAVYNHALNIKEYYHKPISELKTSFLLTGSREDEFAGSGFYDELYDEIIRKAGHGRKHIFKHGGHPAMFSNQEEFIRISLEFLKNR